MIPISVHNSPSKAIFEFFEASYVILIHVRELLVPKGVLSPDYILETPESSLGDQSILKYPQWWEHIAIHSTPSSFGQPDSWMDIALYGFRNLPSWNFHPFRLVLFLMVNDASCTRQKIGLPALSLHPQDLKIKNLWWHGFS